MNLADLLSCSDHFYSLKHSFINSQKPGPKVCYRVHVLLLLLLDEKEVANIVTPRQTHMPNL